MIRRSVLAALVLTIAGGVLTPAFAADTATSGPGLCVLGTNHTNGTRDGLCVWMPGSN